MYDMDPKQPRRIKISSAPSICAVLLVGFMHVSGVPMAWAQPSYCEPFPVQVSSAETRSLQRLLPDERAAVGVFDHARKSVVQIIASTITAEPRTGRYRFPGNEFSPTTAIGSGFVWDDEGHVITNAHVVRGATRFGVRFIDERTIQQGFITTTTKTVSAELVGGSMWHDLAVLRVEPREAVVEVGGNTETVLHPVVIGNSDGLARGQRVYAIGNPFEIELSLTFTTGRVSGLKRHRENDDDVLLFDLIQTDASVNPGNSGGPLLDSAGCLIGVNTLGLSRMGTETLNFAVPVNTVLRVVPKLIQTGVYSRPRLGGRAAFNSPTPPGVYFVGGAVSGLRVGIRQADIVQAIGGNTVRTTDDLWRILDYYEPGQVVTLSVLRDGTPDSIAVDVTLSDGPSTGDQYPLRLSW